MGTVTDTRGNDDYCSRTFLTSTFLSMTMLVALVVPAIAADDGGPSYRAGIAPTSLPAGTISSPVITITQVSSSPDQNVGSLRITAPADILVTRASAVRGDTSLPVSVSDGVITVDSVGFTAPGQTATITIDIAITCGNGGSRTWAVAAREASTFADGSGSLAQDPASTLATAIDRCRLGFLEEPRSAGRNVVITSVTADPSGTPIKVRLLDGNGKPSDDAKVAVNLSIVPGTGASQGDAGWRHDGCDERERRRVLRADHRHHRTRVPLASERAGRDRFHSSASFDISDVAKVCSGACSGSSSKGTTTVTVRTASSSGVLTLSVGLDDLDCNNAANQRYRGTSAPATWDITRSDSRTEVTIRLDSADVTKAYNLYDVCFSSPTSSFRNRYNKQIAAGQAGLLKNCPSVLVRTTEPCVLDKWREDGDVLVRFSVPSGDPRGRI